MESLGGVFIATLFGLALALVTLIGEVIYYRGKDRRNNNVVMIKPDDDGNDEKSTHTMESPIFNIPSLNMLGKDNRIANQITFGQEFVAGSEKTINSSSKKVYPRKSIHGHM